MLQFVEWLDANSWIGWVIIAAALNIGLRVQNVEAWLAYGERHPWLAALVRVFRAVFPDPVKAIAAIKLAVEGKVAATAPAAARVVVAAVHTDVELRIEPRPPAPPRPSGSFYDAETPPSGLLAVQPFDVDVADFTPAPMTPPETPDSKRMRARR